MRGHRLSGAVGAVLALGVLVACTTPNPAPQNPAVTTTTVPAGYPTAPVGDELVGINEIQLLGAHNSYHVAPVPAVASLLSSAASTFPELAAGLGNPASLNYTHASIPQQLARGIRTFEFDIYADPGGGRFSSPLLAGLIGFNDPGLPAGLAEPGFKMLHIVDIDWRTRCVSLERCLEEIREYSNDNPGHLPIIVNLELKSDRLPAPLSGTPTLPFDSALLDTLDNDLRTVLGDRLITPDDVRGAAPDLNTAITTTGWPSVAESRGKVMFFMDNADLRTTYLDGHPSLQNRVMFTSSGEGQPDGAVLKVNDPGDGTLISQLVSDGYLVRTRADADLLEAWANDDSRAQIALGSGAQIVHTDFPVGEAHPSNGYQVKLDLPVQGRCNPVNTTAPTCSPGALVEP